MFVVDNAYAPPTSLQLTQDSQVTQIELGSLMPLTAPNSPVFPLSPLSPISPLPLVWAEEIGNTIGEGERLLA